MGVTERRTRHKEILRRQILDAAREVFVKEGYESVSMRKIAERIEYSPTTIYLYFRDKADLLNRLSEEVFAPLLQETERIMAESGDPVERLRRGLRTYVDFGLRNPNDYRVALLTAQHGPVERERPTAWKVYSWLRSTVEECVRSGRFRSVDVSTAAQTLLAAVHGVTSLLIIQDQFPWVEREQLIDTVIATAVAGFSA
jgi:AcrR family transcriptional regulator